MLNLKVLFSSGSFHLVHFHKTDFGQSLGIRVETKQEGELMFVAQQLCQSSYRRTFLLGPLADFWES